MFLRRQLQISSSPFLDDSLGQKKKTVQDPAPGLRSQTLAVGVGQAAPEP